DGSAWTVCEDWDSQTGIVNDLFTVDAATDASYPVLLHRFRDEPLFLEVIQAIQALQESLDTSPENPALRRARHHASQYMIDSGKLWKLFGGARARARPRVECVPRSEAVLLAREQHMTGGHWGRDAIKLALLDRIWSPNLDASILEAI
ncbi:hypothetical protein CERSUDRAFT_36369, partial [Gelatoporia subvermispora B]